MGEQTKIQWAHHTWNPWRGCEHALLPDGTPHPGCLHCYAETMSRRNPASLGVWGAEGPRIRAPETYLRQPHHWDLAAAADLQRHRVFFSLGDPFEDFQGRLMTRERRVLLSLDGRITFDANDNYPKPATLDDLRRLDLFPTIDACQNLDFLLLTKRPENVARMWQPKWEQRENVWLLYSASDQTSLNAHRQTLRGLYRFSPVVGLSLEPLVGPIDLRGMLIEWERDGSTFFSPVPRSTTRRIFDWVIVGGESGSAARPCNLAWIRSIVQQCAAAGVPCFVKQLGEYVVEDADAWRSRALTRVLDHRGVNLPAGLVRWAMQLDKKGGDPAEWPEDLRVREFPRVEVFA